MLTARKRRTGRQGRTKRTFVAFVFSVSAVLSAFFAKPLQAQTGAERHVAGRFTILAYPQDRELARNLLIAAQTNDTFPGLPRSQRAVTISLAPDDVRFREWTGSGFPEWGAAAAFPESQRIVMHGRAAAKNEDPRVVLRHELAHLILSEAMGGLPPRWFNEGYASYAAAEWGREEILATSLALLLRGPKTLEALDSSFYGGSTRATAAYALAHRAVAELAGLDERRGLTMLFSHWKASGSLDLGIREAYGMTLGAFEERWRTRTRRRYGGIALVADMAMVAGLLGLVVLPLYLGRRKREKKRLESLQLREAEQERRARESALDAMLPEIQQIRNPQLLDTPPDQL